MGRRVWIDLENSPHVLFFRPWISWLREEGHEVAVSARDLSQTCDLLRLHGIDFVQIGRHAGGGRLGKGMRTLARARELIRWAHGRGFRLALGHGSRAQALAAFALGVPALTFFDYEHISARLFGLFCREAFVPDSVPRGVLRRHGIPAGKLVAYPGFKEQIYLDPLCDRPRPVDPPLVVVRPPARLAHYHAAASEEVFRALLARLRRAEDGRRVLLLPRYPEDLPELRAIASGAEWMGVAETPRDGRALLLESSLVVSGGGTMVREAAVLGIPAASYFAGPMGGVDRRLNELGRLRFLRAAGDVAALPLPGRPGGEGAPAAMPIPDSRVVRAFLRERVRRWLA